MHRIDLTPQKSCERVTRQTILGPFVACIVTAVCSSLPNEAFAQAAHYQIEFSVAKNLPKCDRALDFEGMLGNLLAKPLLVPPASRVLAVQIAKTTTGDFGVNLAGKESDGRAVWSLHHEFSAETSCFEVLHKAALRAAIAMEHQASLEEPPPPEISPQCPTPAPALQCPTPDPPKPEPPKPARIERYWFVGAGGIMGFGIAPEIAPGVQLLAGWKWSPSWSFELNARATIPQDSRPLGPTLVRVYTVLSATGAACYRFGSVGTCALVTGSNLWAAPTSIAQTDVRSAQGFGVGMRGFLEHPFSDRWSMRMDLDIIAPVVRTQIEDGALIPRWTAPHINGSASVSVITWF